MANDPAPAVVAANKLLPKVNLLSLFSLRILLACAIPP